jgi:hypothetical protein
MSANLDWAGGVAQDREIAEHVVAEGQRADHGAPDLDILKCRLLKRQFTVNTTGHVNRGIDLAVDVENTRRGDAAFDDDLAGRGGVRRGQRVGRDDPSQISPDDERRGGSAGIGLDNAFGP